MRLAPLYYLRYETEEKQEKQQKRETNSQASTGRSVWHREGYTLRAPSFVITDITLPHAVISTTVFGDAVNCSAYLWETVAIVG